MAPLGRNPCFGRDSYSRALVAPGHVMAHRRGSGIVGAAANGIEGETAPSTAPSPSSNCLPSHENFNRIPNAHNYLQYLDCGKEFPSNRVKVLFLQDAPTSRISRLVAFMHKGEFLCGWHSINITNSIFS